MESALETLLHRLRTFMLGFFAPFFLVHFVGALPVLRGAAHPGRPGRAGGPAEQRHGGHLGFWCKRAADTPLLCFWRGAGVRLQRELLSSF